MRETAQAWIGVSNREESMARVLSRAEYHEGTVHHAHRAALCTLVAVFADRGWAHTSDRCSDLCSMLAAHDIVAPTDVLRAADTLDAHREKLDPESTGHNPATLCDGSVGVDSLACARVVRGFVNTVLSK